MPNACSVEGRRCVLEPVIARYRNRGIDLYFGADTPSPKVHIYEMREAESIRYAIRSPANRVLQEHIAHLLTRPVGRLPNKLQIFFAGLKYQAQSWSKPRRRSPRADGIGISVISMSASSPAT